MPALAILALLPAYALDLEVRYDAPRSGYSGTWTFTAADVAAPALVVVPCPGKGTCRLVLTVERRDEEFATLRMELGRQRSGKWADNLQEEETAVQIGERWGYHLAGTGMRMHLEVRVAEGEPASAP